MKPHAEIRKVLVEGIRKADKPDIVEKHREDDDSRRAFHQNYARLIRVAGHQ